jgi:hypothetical protein
VGGEKRPRVRKENSDWECEREVQAESVSGELRLGVYSMWGVQAESVRE